jgi:hypothetical protein
MHGIFRRRASTVLALLAAAAIGLAGGPGRAEEKPEVGPPLEF